MDGRDCQRFKDDRSNRTHQSRGGIRCIEIFRWKEMARSAGSTSRIVKLKKRRKEVYYVLSFITYTGAIGVCSIRFSRGLGYMYLLVDVIRDSAILKMKAFRN